MKLACRLILVLAVLCTDFVVNADAPAKASPKEALRALNDLIGPWRGTGVPMGSKDEQQRGFWTETITWGWQFKGKDAWLKVDFDKGKYLQAGELRYLPEKDIYQLNVTTPDKEKQTYTGKLEKRVLTLDRQTPAETQRLVVTLLHTNRFLYRYEVKPAGKALFSKRYQVGAVREGVSFAEGDGRPECIVSGGLGITAVSYKGQTYYVCCGGCRDEFNENPEKYIKESKAKKAKK